MMLWVGHSYEVYKKDNWVTGVHIINTEQAEFLLQILFVIIRISM